MTVRNCGCKKIPLSFFLKNEQARGEFLKQTRDQEDEISMEQ